MKSIILAGGVGTRLWPLSREYYPKQFIQLDDLSLFQQTFKRATRLSQPDEIYIVTNEIHQYLVRNQIVEMGYEVPQDHILIEPEGKNTLPAIAWALQRIRCESGSASAVVFPSDHLLGDSALGQIRAAEPLAARYLVTFGIRPTSPHTGYGYIRPGKPLEVGNAVDEFKEKPDEVTAGEYVRQGYFWNSGIFLLSTDVFFTELEKYNPKLFSAFSSDTFPDWTGLESISIDYGLLEHSGQVAVVPLDAGWNDLGTFRAMYEVKEGDASGNVGDAEYIAAKNNYVHAPGKKVGMIGVENLIVVDTADSLLICDNQHTEQVKQLVNRFNDRKDPVTKFHRQVHRPWGSYTILEETPAFKIKRVTVNPTQKLSLQLHHHRSEHWVIVRGTADIELDGSHQILHQGESSFVKRGVKHRLANPGKIPLEVIEVQFGEYLEEDDIVRFDDVYGRN